MTADSKQVSPNKVREPFQKQFVPDQIVLWPERLMICFSIFILAILLPIPISICNAILQLLTLQPLQALKSLVGGVVVTFGLMLIACIGVIPFLLNRVTAFAFCPAAYTDDTKHTKAVNTNKGEIYKYVILPSGIKRENEPTPDVHIILFNGSTGTYTRASAYQRGKRYLHIFHYPGVETDPTKKNYRLSSSTDAVNAGIAVVYDLIEEEKWSKEDVENKLRLVGLSLGGGVAYRVAQHFKNKHKYNIHVDGQNTFWSIRAIIAGQIKTFLNLPLWCGRLFARMILSASGGFELDTLDAALDLDPQYVHFNNVKYNDNKSQNKPLLEKIYCYLGGSSQRFRKMYRYFWGSPNHDADYVLTDGATLNKEMKNRAKGSTNTYFVRLGMTVHTKEIARCGYDIPTDEDNPPFFLYKLLLGPYRKGRNNHETFLPSLSPLSPGH